MMKVKNKKVKVTVPASYSFILDDTDHVEMYPVEVTKLPSGHYSVEGGLDVVEAFVDDICIGDEESVEDILDTME